MADNGGHSQNRQRQSLRWLLAINATMFAVELSVGLLATSTALIADALDMLADASVYAISLLAVGARARLQNRAARISGWIQIVLGLGVLVEVSRRFFTDSLPDPQLMLLVGLAALFANLFCLRLIWQYRQGAVHMRASWIFTVNDVLANLGVMLAALLVWWLESRIPDLVVGTLIAAIVIRGGIQIIQESD